MDNRPADEFAPASVATRILATHGKTFYWASFFLSREKAEAASLLYAGCRMLDDIADVTADDQGSTTDLLQSIKRQIGTRDVVDTHPVSSLFIRLIDRYGIDPVVVNDLLEGLIQDTRGVALTSQQALESYCYRVAGTVGIMMCSILGVHQRAAMPFAIDLGIAMQLTNIARDVLEDAKLGRRYLPFSEPATSIVRAADSTKQQVAQVIAQQLRIAESFYESGISGIAYLPRGSRVGIYLAATLYRAIGRKLKRNAYRWWLGRTVVSKTHKCAITVLALPKLVMLLCRRDAPPQIGHCTELHQNLAALPYVDRQ